MIEHYSLYEINKLTDRFGLTGGVPKGVKPRYNTCPVQSAPVIVRSGDAVELRMMGWGLVSQGAKDTNSVFRYKTFNVQSEKVFTKDSWDKPVRSQRCIIPVNGFYMIRSDNNDAYYFTLPDKSVMGLAGFYTMSTDAEGTLRQTYTLLTIESNAAMPLPFGRMPVILHTEDEAAWIDSEVQDFSTIVRSMRPFETSVLVYKRVSGNVSSVKNDTPSLIEPLKK